MLLFRKLHVLWHSVQAEVGDVKTVTAAGRPKTCDVTEEQLQGLMRSAPVSVSVERGNLFAVQNKMLELWLVKTYKFM
jgi:hypothetical protein